MADGRKLTDLQRRLRNIDFETDAFRELAGQKPKKDNRTLPERLREATSEEERRTILNEGIQKKLQTIEKTKLDDRIKSLIEQGATGDEESLNTVLDAESQPKAPSQFGRTLGQAAAAQLPFGIGQRALEAFGLTGSPDTPEVTPTGGDTLESLLEQGFSPEDAQTLIQEQQPKQPVVDETTRAEAIDLLKQQGIARKNDENAFLDERRIRLAMEQLAAPDEEGDTTLAGAFSPPPAVAPTAFGDLGLGLEDEGFVSTDPQNVPSITPIDDTTPEPLVTPISDTTPQTGEFPITEDTQEPLINVPAEPTATVDKSFIPSESGQEEGAFSSVFDKKPRVEISDRDSKIRLQLSKFPSQFSPKSEGDQFLAHILKGGDDLPLPIENVLKHDELFSKFPDLKNVSVRPVDFLNDERAIAGYSAKEDTIFLNMKFHDKFKEPDVMRRVILHELQHAIQHKSGLSEEGIVNYEDSLKEIEAFSTERRRNLSNEERQQQDPFQTGVKRLQALKNQGALEGAKSGGEGTAVAFKLTSEGSEDGITVGGKFTPQSELDKVKLKKTNFPGEFTAIVGGEEFVIKRIEKDNPSEPKEWGIFKLENDTEEWIETTNTKDAAKAILLEVQKDKIPDLNFIASAFPESKIKTKQDVEETLDDLEGKAQRNELGSKMTNELKKLTNNFKLSSLIRAINKRREPGTEISMTGNLS